MMLKECHLSSTVHFYHREQTHYFCSIPPQCTDHFVFMNELSSSHRYLCKSCGNNSIIKFSAALLFYEVAGAV